MSSEFESYVARLKTKHGDKFSGAGLSQKFAPYFGRRYWLKVRDGDMVKWGYVTGTTGWRPSLMLIHWNEHGSSFLLDDRCEILEIQRV